MKFNIKKEQLEGPLSLVTNIVNIKHIKPKLQNIKIAINENILSLTGYDGEIEMVVIAGEVQSENMSILVSPKQLLTMVKCVEKDSNLELEIVDNRHITIATGGDEYKLIALDASDFPAMILHEKVSPQEIINLKIESEKLSSSIQKIIHAVANQDIRQYLNGMLFEFEGDKLNIVATDSHRLGIDVVSLDSSICEAKKRFVVTRKTVMEMLRILSVEKHVHIAFSEHTLIVSAGNIKFGAKLMNINYPPYDRVVPEISSDYFACKIGDLKNSIKKTSVVSGKNNGVSFNLVDAQIVCDSVNIDTNEMVKTNLKAEINTDYVEMSFNSKYLLDITQSNNDTDEVVFYMNRKASGVLICSKNDENVKYVLMQMKV
jgi:DNA polymerase-3 subunit beta